MPLVINNLGVGKHTHTYSCLHRISFKKPGKCQPNANASGVINLFLGYCGILEIPTVVLPKILLIPEAINTIIITVSTISHLIINSKSL